MEKYPFFLVLDGSGAILPMTLFSWCSAHPMSSIWSSTLTLTLAGSQVAHGVHGVTLIIFVLNIRESWLLRVFLIGYKSNRELEK